MMSLDCSQGIVYRLKLQIDYEVAVEETRRMTFILFKVSRLHFFIPKAARTDETKYFAY